MRCFSSHGAFRRLGYAGVLAMFGLAGCSGFEPVATYSPTTDAGQLYTALQLNYHGITLSVDPAYNTIQLEATALNGRGEPMAGLPLPTFTSLDTSAVKVTSDGLVRAVGVTGKVMVIADLLSSNNIHHADTTFIRVTSETAPPELGSVSLDAVPPDSAIVPMIPPDGAQIALTFFALYAGGLVQFYDQGWPLRYSALSTTGDTLAGLLFSFRSLNPDIAVIRGTDQVVPLRPGHVQLVMEATAYGTTKVDTASYTMTRPTFFDIEVSDTGFSPRHLRLARNAIVTWAGRSPMLMDVTFDDPTNVAAPPVSVCDGWSLFFGAAPGPYCGAGNITTFMGGQDFFPVLDDGTWAARMRQFPVPGVYNFRNTLTGATGQVEIVDE